MLASGLVENTSITHLNMAHNKVRAVHQWAIQVTKGDNAMCTPHLHALSSVGAPAPSSAPVAQAEHQAAPQQLLPPTPAGGGPWHARTGQAAGRAQRHCHPGAAGKWRSAGREGGGGPRLGRCCWRCCFWLKAKHQLSTVPDRTGVRVVERTTCSVRVGACRRALLLAGYIPHSLIKHLPFLCTPCRTTRSTRRAPSRWHACSRQTQRSSL